MTHVLSLVVCLSIMAAIHALGGLIEVRSDRPFLVLAVGFILLAAFITGRVVSRFELPRVTGYLLLGITIGPHVLDLVTSPMSGQLQFINGLAISLIALSAGGELKIEWLNSRLKEIVTIALIGAAIVFLVVSVMVFSIRNWLPFNETQTMSLDIVIAITFGVFSVASSPMVVIAIINETDNRGSLAQLILGVTIVRDVMVIVLFSVLLTVADVVFSGEAISFIRLTEMIGREIFGSLLIGVLLGAILSWCAQNIWREMPMVVMVFCFFLAHLGTELHIDPLIAGLTAGFFVENIAKKGGPELIAGIERCSLPLYCLFFGLAGITLDISVLVRLWPLAILLAGTRGLGVWLGTTVSARLAGSDAVVKRYGWMGFIANAGVLLAMASILARTFPAWGVSIQTLVVAIIAINLLLGPIGFRYALLRAKDSGPSADAATAPMSS